MNVWVRKRIYIAKERQCLHLYNIANIAIYASIKISIFSQYRDDVSLLGVSKKLKLNTCFLFQTEYGQCSRTWHPCQEHWQDPLCSVCIWWSVWLDFERPSSHWFFTDRYSCCGFALFTLCVWPPDSTQAFLSTAVNPLDPLDIWNIYCYCPTLPYFLPDRVEILERDFRRKRDADQKEMFRHLPRIPNPIACLAPNDMLIFQLTINHTGMSLLNTKNQHIPSNKNNSFKIWEFMENSM